MKKNIGALIIMLLLFILQMSLLNAQNLSGSYSIGTSGGTDYSTISAAISDLNIGTISGDIVFNMEAGTYNETMDLSSINNGNFTVTFSGASKETTILHPLDSIVADSSGISIRNSHNIVLKDFTLEMDDISSTVVEFIDPPQLQASNHTKGINVSGGSNIRIENAIINNANYVANEDTETYISSGISLLDVEEVIIADCEVSGAGMLIYIDDFENVVITNCDFQDGHFHIRNSQSDGSTGSGLFIDNNIFTGPFPSDRRASAIYLVGEASSSSADVHITYNTIDGKTPEADEDSFGMFLQGLSEPYITNNTIENGYHGVRIIGSTPNFYSNQIIGTSNVALNYHQIGAGDFVNNILVTDHTALTGTFSSNVSIVHNTISSGGSDNGIHLVGMSGDNFKLVNNVFDVASTVQNEVVLDFIRANIRTIDHNLYSGNAEINTAKIIMWGGGTGPSYDAASLGEWQTVQPELNQNSQSFNPSFVGGGDYHIANGTDFRFGTYIESVDTDFEGHIRDASIGIDVGADQYCTSCNIVWSGDWSNMTGPDENVDVVINADYSLDSEGNFTCKKLVVCKEKELIVTDNSVLDVRGDIINNGTIDTNSGGTLLTYDGVEYSGNEIIVRKNTRYGDGRYSMVGSPVEQSTAVKGSTLGQYIYQYDETVPYNSESLGLEKWVSADDYELTPGRGYTQAGQKEIIFTGKPNAGPITYSGTYTSDDGVHEGFNLISNPYTAAISVSAFLTENTNIGAAVYLWDDNGSDSERGTNSDYIVANAITATNTTPAGGASRYNAYLGSAQGFFVKLTGAVDTDITFTEAMRVTGNNSDDNFFRTLSTPIVRINLTNAEGLFKQTVVAWKEDGSSWKLIRGYDAPIFDNSSEYQIYTMKENEMLAIHTQPLDWSEVPIGMNLGIISEYSLSLEGSQTVFLQDNLTEEIINLNEGPYNFSNTKIGAITERFTLISRPGAILNITKTPRLMVFSNKKNIHVIAEDGEMRMIRVYDVQGKLRIAKRLKRSEVIDANFLPQGIYIITDGSHTHKLLLR